MRISRRRTTYYKRYDRNMSFNQFKIIMKNIDYADYKTLNFPNKLSDVCTLFSKKRSLYVYFYIDYSENKTPFTKKKFRYMLKKMNKKDK